MKDLDHFVRLVTLLCLAGLWGAAPVLAQQEVSGTVSDAQTGDALPGASVAVPGTTVGTATGPQGQYSLELPAEADSLRFSFVGYEARTVAIDGRSTINVALAPATAQLEELVVIGYGAVEERDVTGAVERVDPQDFNTSAAVSPEQIIAGKVAGVQISSNDGSPGGGNTIRIRGATSVNASSAPLFVIDGVPISNEGNQASRNPLNFLNPNDIQSVTVLKDASATAIYGSRGANGVILIETRSAEEGAARIRYNGELLASTVTDRIGVLDVSRFRQVVQEREPQLMGTLGDARTDWQDAVQRDAFGQEHNLSFARGYDDSSFRISMNYLDQEGVLQTSTTQRLSLSLNYDQQLFDDRLSINTSLRGAQTQDEYAPGLVGSAATFAPTQPIRQVGSEYGGFFEWDQTLAENNPVAEFILTENVGTTYRSLGSIDAEYQVPGLEGLSVRSVLGYDLSTGEREFFAPTYLKSQAESDRPGTVERRSFTRLNKLLDVFLNYNREFESLQSDIDFTAGYSYQDFDEEYPEFTAQGLSSNIYGRNSTAPADFRTTYVTEIPSRLISGFGRLNYTFMDRYLLTFTIRRDGSSRFSEENQWGTFPSAALAWRLDEEPFMEELGFISTLKPRVSWGITGNQEIGDFLYRPLYTPGGPQAQIQFGDRYVSTLRPGAADESIKWEETTSTNIGFDYGFFADRLTGSFNYYYSKTEDLLFEVPVAGGANLGNRVLTNIGSMRNRGIEFGLNAAVAETEDFSYNAQINLSTNDNELLTIDRAGENRFTIDTGGISGAVGTTVQVLREGEPLNSFYLYRHKMNEEGDPVYADVNEDGSINEQDLYEDVNGDGLINEQDRVVAGNPQPDWIIGHTSQLRYRAFDLSFTLRAHLGGDVYNNVASNYGHYDRLTDFVPSNLHESVLEYGFIEPQYLSDVYLEDGSFLRMDNISLGYTVRSIPYVSQLRVYGSVSNAFILTGYSGTDPEIGGSGIDNNLYPRSRTFTGGVDIQF